LPPDGRNNEQKKTGCCGTDVMKIGFSWVGRAALSPPCIVTMLFLRRLEGKPPYHGNIRREYLLQSDITEKEKCPLHGPFGPCRGFIHFITSRCPSC